VTEVQVIFSLKIVRMTVMYVTTKVKGRDIYIPALTGKRRPAAVYNN